MSSFIESGIKSQRFADIYADELHQYDPNAEGARDPGRHFIACVEGDELVDYISLNPPETNPSD